MRKFTSVICAMLLPATALFAQEQPTGVFMNLFANDMAQPKGISENGKWACGSAFWTGAENQAGTINASKWNLETGERTFLVDQDVMSDAYCISNDGSLVCGSFLGEPAYNLNGEWFELPTPRGYDAGGDATTMAIVGTDTIMMGYAAKSQTEQVIVRWVNGKIDNNFKLRDYTRYAEIMGDSIKGETGIVRGMSNDGERYLVSLDYNLLPAASSTNLPTTFVQFGGDENYTTTVIEREFDIYDLVSFVEEATMSHNGKFVCGRIYAVPRTGIEAPEVPSVAFLYDIDNDEFKHYTAINNTGRYAGASCVDNQGNVYFKSVNGADPLGRPYINKDGKFIELEACLLAYEGITAEQIDAIAEEVPGSDADDLGIVWCVSGDGKTLIGAGDALKGNIWCARLSCSPYEVEPVELGTPVENVTYNNLTANYANGEIILSGIANMVEVYSITGAKVLAHTGETSSIKANLNNGIYIVKAYTSTNLIVTSKIVVK